MTHDTRAATFISDETAPALSEGQRILGRYVLSRVLGRGGMGVVWLAHDDELDRDVALKFLPQAVVNDSAGLVELKRETRRSLELTHPNIVRTYDFVQDSTIAGISMEFVDADTLRNRRAAQRGSVFQPAELGPWIVQLCDALDYAHIDAAIVHRDLKPANLMVNRRNQLKVADFGIARSLVETLTQVTGMRGVSGTLVYMSPQQLTGEPPTPADDVYAVGATLYELCTSRPPFYSGDVSGQIYNKAAPAMMDRRQQLGLAVGDMPSNWEETVAECLAKEPAQRPASAGEIAVRLGLIEAAALRAPRQNTQPTVAIVPRPPQADGIPRTTYAIASAGPAAAAPGTTIHLPALPKNFLPVAGLAAAAIVCVGALGLSTAWYYWSHRPAGPAPGEPKLALTTRQNPFPAGPIAQPKPPLEPIGQLEVHSSLMVKSEPPNAVVRVDGGPAFRTPAVIPDLAAGKHQVELALEGYDPVRLSTEIRDAHPVDLGTTALVRSTGRLRIDSNPPKLKFLLRSKTNQLENKTGETPLDPTPIPTGDYEITVTRDGWPPVTKPVSINPTQEQSANFEFLTGGVTFASTPPGAKVMVGDKTIGVTPYHLADQPPGDLRYSLQLTGYTKFEGSVTVPPGQEVQAVPATLTKPAKVASATTAHKSTSGRGSNSSGRSSGSSDRDRDNRPSRAMEWFRTVAPGGIIH